MKPQKIRALMIENDVRQTDVANHLGLSRATVCSVISGRSTSRRVSTEIARRLNMPIEKLWPRLAA